MYVITYQINISVCYACNIVWIYRWARLSIMYDYKSIYDYH
ncbi:MAG: hypothetical protein JETT_3791 [Candidatus Jettenia ecosi]|uniref:Uncharacterized protein n=1 Tax=Candidatus Jettenia ecosi TaxID=2494326 RepID=A0A533Q755_9BACT|nr:MAG: hypothetical protein JETT_3791 [Candidatus Jettenia ecosi]